MTELTNIYRRGYLHLTAYESEFRSRLKTLEILVEQNKIAFVHEVIESMKISLGYMADDIKLTDDEVLEHM